MFPPPRKLLPDSGLNTHDPPTLRQRPLDFPTHSRAPQPPVHPPASSSLPCAAGSGAPGATALLRADSTEPLRVGMQVPDRTGEKLPASGLPGDASVAAPTRQVKGYDLEVT